MEYDYSPNKLAITEVKLSRIPSLQNINQYILQVSYVVSIIICFIHQCYFCLEKIPEIYKCTGLKNKYFKVVILTASEEKSNIHPMYKIIDEQIPVDSKLISINQYAST